ncbi:MAG: copper resistance protein [Aliidongia sp.]|nr:copper resistance protein [Aliidongia sp.]
MIDGIEAALLLARLVHFASTLGLFGAVAFAAYAGPAGKPVAPELRHGLIVAAVASLASAIGWLLLEAASFADDWWAAIDPEMIGAVLTDTGFGRIWGVRLAVALAAVGLATVPGRSQLPLGLAAAILAGTLGLTGHAAMETDALGLVHRLNHALHLLSIGVWFGGLWPLAAALHQAPPLAALAVRRFSSVGIVIVALIVGSGAVNSWFLIGNWSGLWQSDYGRVLVVKVLLVGGMIGVAAINRLVLVARIEAPTTLARLARNVTIEQALGLAILAAASLLGTLPPAGYGPAQ